MRICVVGAGPAGLYTSLYLSDRGHDVTVIDRFSENGYGRYHSVCGAGISLKAFRQLEYIDEKFIINRVDNTVLSFPGDTDIIMKIDGAVVDRVPFLLDLKQKCSDAGCVFIQDNVLKVERNDGFNVHTGRNGTMHFDVIVGCDGAHSVVRRDIFKTEPKGMVPVTECIIDRPNNGSFKIFLGEKYKGMYEWDFPSGNRTNAGSVKGMADLTDAVSHGSRHIPYGSVPLIADDNAYLCGDAAGMPNPISFGGLRIAMVSGMECAKAIITGSEKQYQKWWKKNILSSERFMEFRYSMEKWTDKEFIEASETFRKHKNIYIGGIIATLKHPKYVKMYVGCLMTFKHSW